MKDKEETIVQSMLTNKEETKSSTNLADSFKTIILFIYHYIVDTFLFYFKHNDSVQKIYQYPIIKHISYMLISSVMIAYIPLCIGLRIIWNHPKAGLDIHAYKVLLLVIGTSIILYLVSKIISIIGIKLLEQIIHRHNIGIIALLKAFNIQSITLHPFIIVGGSLYLMFGHKIKIAFLSLFLIFVGIVLSYFIVCKMMMDFGIIHIKRLLFLVMIAILFSLLVVVNSFILWNVAKPLLSLLLR